MTGADKLWIAAGRIVTYTGDISAVSNPTANSDRVKFHSDWDYVGVVREITATRTNVGRLTGLGSHGQSGRPLVLGRITACSQSHLVGRTLGGTLFSGEHTMPEWMSLQTDASAIYLVRETIRRGVADDFTWPGLSTLASITLEIKVLNVTV